MTGHPGWPAELTAGPVVLRPPRLRDGRAWSEVRLRNEAWLTPWEPTSPHGWQDAQRDQRVAGVAVGAAQGRPGPAPCCRS